MRHNAHSFSGLRYIYAHQCGSIFDIYAGTSSIAGWSDAYTSKSQNGPWSRACVVYGAC